MADIIATPLSLQAICRALTKDRSDPLPFEQTRSGNIWTEDPARGWYNSALVEEFSRLQSQGSI